uniref:Uncharacterized protein n=1 Tax=uncultured Vibrionales bacterium HF0010_22E23 TaxID=710999 RepID=E0XRI9_9GAMM|nr:hypothetical protein [uncultured Vibrionales bacterium HF0010_22E23]
MLRCPTFKSRSYFEIFQCCCHNPQNALLTCLNPIQPLAFSVEAGGHSTDSNQRVKHLFFINFAGYFRRIDSVRLRVRQCAPCR